MWATTLLMILAFAVGLVMARLHYKGEIEILEDELEVMNRKYNETNSKFQVLNKKFVERKRDAHGRYA